MIRIAANGGSEVGHGAAVIVDVLRFHSDKEIGLSQSAGELLPAALGALVKQRADDGGGGDDDGKEDGEDGGDLVAARPLRELVERGRWAGLDGSSFHETPNVRSKSVGALVTLRWSRLRRTCNDPFQILWQARTRFGRLEDGTGLLRRRCRIGQVASEHEVQNHSEGEHIGADIDMLTRCALLRAHVAGRANDHAHASRGCVGGQGFLHGFGNAEVNDFEHRIAAGGVRDEDVFWFEIAMQDAALVRVADGFAKIQEQAEAFVELRFLPSHVSIQRHPIDEFHREEGMAVTRLSPVKDLRDVRMAEALQCCDLAAEPRMTFRVKGGVLEDLDGDAHRRVRGGLGVEDTGKGSFTEEGQKLIPRDSGEIGLDENGLRLVLQSQHAHGAEARWRICGNLHAAGRTGSGGGGAHEAEARRASRSASSSDSTSAGSSTVAER